MSETGQQLAAAEWSADHCLGRSATGQFDRPLPRLWLGSPSTDANHNRRQSIVHMVEPDIVPGLVPTGRRRRRLIRGVLPARVKEFAGRALGVPLAIGSETRLESLRTGIRTIRRDSRNPTVGMMVGGPPFIEHPELVAHVGADRTAADGQEAVIQAQSLLTLLPACV